MDIKLHFSFKNIGGYVMKHLGFVTLFIGLLFASAVGYFLYTNVYQTLISPTEIDKSEIIAKKQKVNLDLFTDINDKIKAKKSISEEQIGRITNPF